MNNKALIAGVVLLVAVAGVLQWRHTGGVSGADALKRAADKANLTLPRPYVNGLVFEHAHVVGDRLVTDVYIPDIRLAQLDQKKLPMIHRQEQGDLIESACADPEQRALLRDKAQVARRFLDQEHKLIFEIAASEADCKPKVVE